MAFFLTQCNEETSAIVHMANLLSLKPVTSIQLQIKLDVESGTFIEKIMLFIGKILGRDYVDTFPVNSEMEVS